MAGAAVAAPSVVKAQGPVNMRWQSTWPSKDIFHEYANDFAKKVNDMTGGELRIEVLPAGAVVPAFGLLDAVSSGTLDGGHGVCVYHYGKQQALALWGSGPGCAMDANMLLAWHKYGGGKELLDKIYSSIGANVRSFMYGPMPSQPLGWFKKPIAKAEDLKGLKFRTVGISIDVFQTMGLAVNALPGGEIVAAMDRGLLDAAEFNNASSDRVLGFADVSKVCMLQSFHQNAEQFEILFNKAKYDGLPEKMRAVIANAVEAASAGHVVEGDRPLLEGLCRDAGQGQRPLLQDAGRHPAAAARGLRRGREEAGRGESAVQGDHAVADRLRRAHDALGAGHGHQPPHGLRPLLRQERRGQEALTPPPIRRGTIRPVPNGASLIDHPFDCWPHERPAIPAHDRRHQHLDGQGCGLAHHRC